MSVLHRPSSYQKVLRRAECNYYTLAHRPSEIPLHQSSTEERLHPSHIKCFCIITSPLGAPDHSVHLTDLFAALTVLSVCLRPPASRAKQNHRPGDCAFSPVIPTPVHTPAPRPPRPERWRGSSRARPRRSIARGDGSTGSAADPIGWHADAGRG